MLLKKYKGSRLYETRCKSFADIVGKFADAQSIISRLDEGDGVLAALVNHCTKWHKSGRSFYCEHELECTSSSRMRVIYHNWSATKQRPHPQSVAEISHHSVLSGDRIRQCETSSGSRHKDTDQCL